MKASLLYYKILSLPDSLKKEVEDFLDYLKFKAKHQIPKKKPKFGSAKGTFVMKDDFDEPLDDFQNT